jgi:eukaryotic-like serine/threonine-protein kinase
MGEVYVAVDEMLEREVAVKILAERYAENVEVRRRFTREALAAARLSGERYIVTIYDVGEHEGQPFIVMAYMPGGSMEQRLRRGPPSIAQALTWLEQAGAALDAAHRHGIVHRDVKPGNLLLDVADVVHVGDFGIARAAGLDSLTSPGTILGTAGYLSPEQAVGAPTTTASDRYALGIVAFELLTGRRPFAAETPTAEAFAHAQTPTPRAHDANPRIPPALDSVFDHALAKSPQERPATCQELTDKLRTAFWANESATLIGLRPPAAPTTVMKARLRRRTPSLVAVAWMALGLVGAGAGVTVWRLVGGDGGGAPAARAPVHVTSHVSTVTKTVTSRASPTPARTPAADSRTPTQLNDAGYARLRAGDAAGALPLLERAVAGLQGSGSLTEAYASYNLAWARLELGRCTGVLDLLGRSEAVQGRRKEIDHLRKQAERRCQADEQHGHGD